MSRLHEQYRISDASLRLRHDFIRLTKRDIAVLRSLLPWARRVAPRIGKRFYDHQFAFGETRAFFANHAGRKGVALPAMRDALETTQARHVVEILEEAAGPAQFGAASFERRLHVGQLHSKLDLPLKWYVGSDTVLEVIVRDELRRAYWWNPGPAAPGGACDPSRVQLRPAGDRGVGIAAAVLAVTLLAFFGSAIASAVALMTLMPIYLAVYVFYDSKATAKPASERR